jgi:CHAD domain-containing protein
MYTGKKKLPLHKQGSMEQKEMEQLIKKYFKKLRHLLSEIEKDFDPEAIHHFRVQVKKLRALLRLLATELQDADDLRLPKQLKELYLSAGKVRDMQLHLITVNNTYDEANKPAAYLLLLQNELEKCKVELRLIIKKDSLPGSEVIIISNLPAQLSPENIKVFIRQKEAIINILLSAAQLTNDDLHTVRKNVKDVLYVIKALKEDAERPELVSFLRDNEIKKATVLAEELGKFIDTCMAVSFVKPSRLNEINGAERKQLQDMRKQWQSEMDSVKAKLCSRPAALLFNNIE